MYEAFHCIFTSSSFRWGCNRWLVDTLTAAWGDSGSSLRFLKRCQSWPLPADEPSSDAGVADFGSPRFRYLFRDDAVECKSSIIIC